MHWLFDLRQTFFVHKIYHVKLQYPLAVLEVLKSQDRECTVGLTPLKFVYPRMSRITHVISIFLASDQLHFVTNKNAELAVRSQ